VFEFFFAVFAIMLASCTSHRNAGSPCKCDIGDVARRTVNDPRFVRWVDLSPSERPLYSKWVDLH
jgi:hypothetical protein